jgi:hypothetical protein
MVRDSKVDARRYPDDQATWENMWDVIGTQVKGLWSLKLLLDTNTDQRMWSTAQLGPQWKALVQNHLDLEIAEDFWSLDKVWPIDHLHIGYFLGIAAVEGLSSFLLRKFFSARSTSRDIDSKVGLFSYLMCSTELRVSTLMLIGITRTITYSFQTTARSATRPSRQVDRFVVVLECMFPTVM